MPTGTLKFVSIPVSKNIVLLRVENIADLYDGAQEQVMNVTSLLTQMWTNANRNAILPSFTFSEMSLTGNMLLTEMQGRKINWKTVDDNEMESEQKLDFSVDPSAIKLEP
jgi:hypothetical protein